MAAGVVFLSGNLGPVLCAVVHHSQHVAATHGGAGHHEHGQAPSRAGGSTLDGSHTAPSGCADMGHCGVAVVGMATAVAVLHVARPHAITEPIAVHLSPHTTAFSPPTPPPRA